VRTAALFRKRADVAQAVATRWDYVLVDEVQDLNVPQYEIVQRLVRPHGNLFAVGDDEQSIFSWTGADPRVLLRLREDFGIVRPIVLGKNCRCSRQIFETARRVLAENPQLFDKRLTAERHSEHEVLALAFPDEHAEAGWLIADLSADRDLAGLRWGDYAVLYRKHRVGELLESRLLAAGIPCRLARGRSVAEDEVVGHVVAALRVLRDPGDPVAVAAFARLVFAHHLQEEVQAAAAGRPDDFVDAVRALARSRPASHPDTKRLWRFVYQVENLAALGRQHRSLPALVEDLLSRSIGPYRNVLEERHEELSDPAELPEAGRLAERLDAAISAERPIRIEPQGGLEIALRGMLAAAGVRRVPSSGMGPPARESDVVVRAADGGDAGLALTLFKALQQLHARGLDTALRRYVTFDLETTDNDVATCDIVEIGAARVIDGAVVARFRQLLRPARPISAAAARVHGYTDADVSDAPTFARVWPEFRAFVGGDVLVAHSGQKFDVPVLKRAVAAVAAPGDGAGDLVFYDTLPLARSLAKGSARLTDLAARFGIDPGRPHHALDDAVTLAQVFGELERERLVRARKSLLVNLLDYLGLSLAFEPRATHGGEGQVLFQVARFYALGRYSDCLAFYAAERARTGAASPSVDEVIARLGGAKLMTRLRADRDPAQRYPAAVARLRALMEGDTGTTLEASIDRLLDRVALSTSEGVEAAPDRVNLLTLHSTKGLEFSRVYVVGVEDYELPGYYAATENREDEIQEARRLLYVGMTRARDRLVLTRVEQRFGRSAGGSRFLDEMALASSPPVPPAVRERGNG
jgi:DNA polymerase III epsilon subunit family exonuclease